jgi:hypothetical protein
VNDHQTRTDIACTRHRPRTERYRRSHLDGCQRFDSPTCKPPMAGVSLQEHGLPVSDRRPTGEAALGSGYISSPDETASVGVTSSRSLKAKDIKSRFLPRFCELAMERNRQYERSFLKQKATLVIWVASVLAVLMFLLRVRRQQLSLPCRRCWGHIYRRPSRFPISRHPANSGSGTRCPASGKR